ncbi:MAG: diguanylate cyclase [Desulfuromonadaceae bacterium]|nr:diguanylate cyclase [Desulfuromonadaceae bacterium]MDD2856895.1 diguanylate cyclase [Desulfuromonadaceae bacterium]
MKKTIIFPISLLIACVVGYLDYRSGDHLSMMLLYAVPILLSSWYCGRKEGIAVSFIAAISWLFVNIVHSHSVQINAEFSWNVLTRLGIFCIIAYAVSLQAQLRRALEREKMRADTDRLTGLFNKGAFRERVEEEMSRARRYKHPMTLAFIDLDNFKQVNDTEGHARGDKLLELVSGTIVKTIRGTDIAGRIGGDEFTICFPETGEVEAGNAIGKLVKALDVMTSQSGWQVTASIGVVTCLEISETYDALLGMADKLMYSAKEKGKNSAEFTVV